MTRMTVDIFQTRPCKIERSHMEHDTARGSGSPRRCLHGLVHARWVEAAVKHRRRKPGMEKFQNAVSQSGKNIIGRHTAASRGTTKAGHRRRRVVTKHELAAFQFPI